MVSQSMKLSVLFLACTLGACTLMGDQGRTPPESLREARSLWTDSGVQSYSMRFRWSCFCTIEYVAPVELEVQAGEIVAGRSVETGLSLSPEDLGRYRTIDQLFDMLYDAAEAEAWDITVEYDPVFGFPTSAFIDYERNVADEEMGFAVTEFRRK